MLEVKPPAASTQTNMPLSEAVGPNGKIIGGPFGSDLTQAHYTSTGVPVIRVSNQVGPTVAGDFVFVSPEKAESLSANTALPGDIIVVQRGSTYGKVSRIPLDAPFTAYIVCQSQMAIRVDPSASDPDYLFQYLRSAFFEKYVATSVIQTGQPHINLEILRRARVQLPPLPEQRKIAEILRTWDEAIAACERLIEQLEKRFSATARRFFDPCHPTFDRRPNSWTEFELGEVFVERTQSGEAGDRLLSITMGGGIIDRDDVGRKDTSTEDKSSYKLILPGDIGYNTMRMWQGVCGLSTLRGIVSPAYTIVTPDNANIAAEYAAHLFKSRRMVFDFERYSQGLTSDTWNLKFPAFSKIKLFLPPIDTQHQQAELLDGLTAEIDVIERKRISLAEQKRGLMQKLLTGEWRVTLKEAT